MLTLLPPVAVTLGLLNERDEQSRSTPLIIILEGLDIVVLYKSLYYYFISMVLSLNQFFGKINKK
jgi:hypothetical protein